MTPTQERFDRHWMPVTESGCWIWLGSGVRYGELRVGDRAVRAHRLSWELHRGHIPDGMRVLHKCDVTHCVNPEHLFLGTQLDNMTDMRAKGRAKPPAVQSGESHPRSKLTATKVALIRSSDKSEWELAREIGVSRSTINAVRRGVIWKGVV